MAKDGTARGGQRAGAGRKPKALNEKIATGNPGGRKLKVMDLPEPPDLTGVDMPEPSVYIKAKGRDGEEFTAREIYEETWLWLKERGCEKLISRKTIEQYAMSLFRYEQMESAITKFGPLAKHPTTGAPIASPYVTMANVYQKQAAAIWYNIFNVVKENCATDYEGGSQPEDMMERLLRTGRSN